MGRGVVGLEYIANAKSRKTTFQKRKTSLLKKAYEFSVLCEVDICLLISGPNLDEVNNKNQLLPRPLEFHTWPPENGDVLRIIKKYQTGILCKPPKKSSKLKDTLVDRQKKVDSEISRCRRKLYGVKYPTSEDLIHRFSADELAGLLNRLDSKIELVEKKIHVMRKESDHNNKNISNNNHIDNINVNGLVFDMPQPQLQPLPLRQVTKLDKIMSPCFDSNFSIVNPNCTMMKLLADNYQTNYGGFEFNYLSSNNRGTTTALQGPLYNFPTAGITFENMMLLNGTPSTETETCTSMLAHYYPPQPPANSTYPLNHVVNLGPTINASTPHGNQLLSDVLHDFLNSSSF